MRGRVCFSLAMRAREGSLKPGEAQWLTAPPCLPTNGDSYQERRGMKLEAEQIRWHKLSDAARSLAAWQGCAGVLVSMAALLFTSLSSHLHLTSLYGLNCFPLENFSRVLLFWSHILSLALSLLKLIAAFSFFFFSPIKTHAPMKETSSKVAEQWEPDWG